MGAPNEKYEKQHSAWSHDTGRRDAGSHAPCATALDVARPANRRSAPSKHRPEAAEELPARPSPETGPLSQTSTSNLMQDWDVQQP
mmetsp:Transcript_23111/g.72469  ORF Transcript_23111/g.72469 Transcript_23111/m.72469 type:complete len:86 (+) Transcript_23111:528-785(+)